MATDTWAPTGYTYDKNGNLKPWHLEGKGKPYAPTGWTYDRSGNLKKVIEKRRIEL
jgi:hypothetical protein